MHDKFSRFPFGQLSLVSNRLAAAETLSIETWTEDDVSNWLRSIGISEQSISKLHDEEVNGKALLAITIDDLTNTLKLKFGPSRNIIHSRDALVSVKIPGEENKEQKNAKRKTSDPKSGKTNAVAYEKVSSAEAANKPKTATKTVDKENKDQATVKQDCSHRPFGTKGSNFTYINHKVLPPETGISDLISPCHEYKAFTTAVLLNDTCKKAKFLCEVLKFGVGCMNMRSNGTIHFGVMDKKDTSCAHGEIIGIPVQGKELYVDALNHMKTYCSTKIDAEHLRRCIRDPEFVEVIDTSTDEKRYVVEVDIEPSISIVKNKVYSVRLPYIDKNDKDKKNVLLTKVAAYCRQGASTETVDLNEFQQKVSEWDALRETAEKQQYVDIPEACPDLGRKLTLLITGGEVLFDNKKWFILVTNRFGSEDLTNIDFLLKMKIFSVFDFDPDSNKSGFCQKYLQHHTASLHFLKDYTLPSGVTVSHLQNRLHLFDQTSWIFCNGRNDLRDNEPVDDITWAATKKTQLKDCVSLICKEILPKGTFTLVILLTSNQVDYPLLHTYSEFFSDMEGHEDIVCISETEGNFEKLKSFATGNSLCFERTVSSASVVGMKIGHVNTTLRRIQSAAPQTAKHLPTYARGDCFLQDLDEDKMFSLEILCMDQYDDTSQGLSKTEKEDIQNLFYRGGKISWMNFWLAEKGEIEEVIQRDAYHTISNLLSDCLKASPDQRHIHSMNIFHHPGSGGSTVARQALWNYRKRLRCAVVKPSCHDKAEIVSDHAHVLRTYEERDNYKCVPVLLLVEDCDDDFLGDLRQALSLKAVQGRVCFIVMSCRQSYNPGKMCKKAPLENVQVRHQLSDREKKQFAMKSEKLQETFKPEFILTFVLMSDGFNEEYLKNFVHTLLQDIDQSHPVIRIIRYVALLNTYLPGSFLSQSHCEDLLYRSGHQIKFQAREEFCQLAFEEALTEPARLLFMHLRDDTTYIKTIRIIHYRVAKEILRQLLHDKFQESELAAQLLDDEVLFQHRFGREKYLQFLRDLFIRRNKVSKGDVTDSSFSPLIEKLRDKKRSKEANDLLQKAYRRFDKDPFFAQCLARLNYMEDNFDEAEVWAETAAKKLPNNPCILHTKGLVYKKSFYKQVADMKTENKLADVTKMADAVGTAMKAMECFQECQSVAVKDRNTMIDSGFFAAVEVGCRLLKLFSASSLFSDKREYTNYLLSDQIPDNLKEPWEHLHDKLKGLHVIIKTSLDWIADDLSYFQRDPSADDEEAEDQIKHPKTWLVIKSAEFGEYFSSFDDTHSAAKTTIPTPTMARMKITQLGGGSMTSIFNILTDVKRKDQVKSLEKLLCLYKLLEKNMNQMDWIHYIATQISLSCLAPQSKELQTLKDLNKQCQRFPKDRRRCHQNALFLLTLLLWPEDHDSEDVKMEKYENILTAVQVLTTSYLDKMKNIPQRKRRIYTHFFLGNGKALGKIVHKSILEKNTDIPAGKKRMMWYTGEVWKLPETAKLLRSVSGWTEDERVYLEVPGKLRFGIPAQNEVSVPFSNENVTFFVGFTMRGPVAYGIARK